MLVVLSQSQEIHSGVIPESECGSLMHFAVFPFKVCFRVLNPNCSLRHLQAITAGPRVERE